MQSLTFLDDSEIKLLDPESADFIDIMWGGDLESVNNFSYTEDPFASS